MTAAGCPTGFSLETSDRLGLQIVRTLVSAELDGSLEMRTGADGGTDVRAAGADRPAGPGPVRTPGAQESKKTRPRHVPGPRS